jgi:predicted secreted protein with PEFG-CTERM motif
MKTKAICSFFVLFAIVAGIGATTPAAFAEATIETADNDLATPGCVETEVGCYTPNTTTVNVGDIVTMTNTDEAGIHTFTSGTVDGFTPSPDGTFDSGMLMKPGDSFEYTTDTVGEFPYYCSLHVWMQGVLIVQEAVDEEAEAQAAADAAAEAQAAADAAAEAQAAADAAAEAEDVELVVTITDSVMGDGTHVYLEFSEIHVNYQITAMQNGEEIFTMTDHAMEMTGANHHIDAVGSEENPIDIEIVSLGIGPDGANQEWTGPTGTVATTQVVPEFGTIAMMVLAVAIISIIAVTAKSRVIPRF